MAKASTFLIPKIGGPKTNSLAYPEHDRANQVYGQWMAGYTEEEIAAFRDLPVEEVKRDIMYQQSQIPVRDIISHNNDRNRILLQREQSDNFRALIASALAKTATDFFDAGLSPAGILKEFREATGMVQKAVPLVQVNTQSNTFNAGGGGGISSTEDVIRKVLEGINHQNASLQSAVAPSEVELESDGSGVYEAQPQEPDEDQTDQ